MSDLIRPAQDAIDVAFGPLARLHFARPAGRCVAYVDDGLWQILAVAGGANSTEACRMLIQMCYRDNQRPTTAEAAAVLGVTAGRVRQLVQAGVLVPEERGIGTREARFRAADVWALVKQESLEP